MTTADLIALAACILAAAAEGALAGPNVLKTLRALRQPWFALPSWTWVPIGLFYYAVIWFVLSGLLTRFAGDLYGAIAIALVVALLAINAIWNWFFFRTRDFMVCVKINMFYLVLIALLFALLLAADRVAATALGFYGLYLIYGVAWTHAIWRLNGRQGL